MTDHTWPFELRRRIYDAREHVVDGQMIGDDAARIDVSQTLPLMGPAMLEEIPPRNAVLRGQHSGLWSHNPRKIANGSGNLMRLHAENNQILLADAGNSIGRLDVTDDRPAFFD